MAAQICERALCLTRYSQGLGRPKAVPQAKGPGLQVVAFTGQLEEPFAVPA